MRGASGYILKGSSVDELVQGLRAVHSGETYVTQGFATKVIVALRNASVRKLAARAIRLSVREDQIVRLFSMGRTNRDRGRPLDQREDGETSHDHADGEASASNRLEVVIQSQGPPENTRSYHADLARRRMMVTTLVIVELSEFWRGSVPDACRNKCGHSSRVHRTGSFQRRAHRTSQAICICNGQA